MNLMSESIDKIAAALVEAQQEMGNASKDSKNPFFKSKYADLNSVREAALPALNKHGIVALQPTVILDGKKFVKTMLVHTSGQYIASLTEILLVKENDAQAQGSGISYARRYGLQSLVNIGSEDDDGQEAVGKPINKTVSSSSVKENVVISAVDKNSGNGTASTNSSESVPANSARRSFRTPQASKGETL